MSKSFQTTGIHDRFTVCFFEVRFFGSFGKLAVQAAQLLAVFGRPTW